ncbi:MAG: hypothetical protein L0241_13830, partial [Planctomycetia bacterium]|nr:hypothetical protein [Planctomycetia bacterium]
AEGAIVMTGFAFRNNWSVADSGDSQQNSGRFLRGSRVQFRRRFNFCQINNTTSPSARFFDGPFLRITPHNWNFDGKTISSRVWGGSSETDVVPDTNGNTHTVPQLLDLFYTIDIPSRPFYLPFNCTVDVIGERARFFLYDCQWSDPGDTSEGADPKVDQRDSIQEFSLTRVTAEGGVATRRHRVPPGAHEFLIMGNAATFAVNVEYEDTGKTGGVGGTSILPILATNGVRYPVGGAEIIEVVSVEGVPVSCSFFIRFG